MRILPILFSTEMVRAILEDRKTVTRRAVKLQHLLVLDSPYHKKHPETPDKVLIEKLCEPPYRPGDILYVRETWASNNITPHDPEWLYKADYDCTIEPYKNWRWRSSIHMPKEAARLFLRVTDVRVERLQDIDAAGIRREGLASAAAFLGDMEIAKQEFALLWDSTVPKHPNKFKRYPYYWADNPWVWVIEFERISRKAALSVEGGTNAGRV